MLALPVAAAAPVPAKLEDGIKERGQDRTIARQSLFWRKGRRAEATMVDDEVWHLL
jgi:hypothetical protein